MDGIIIIFLEEARARPGIASGIGVMSCLNRKRNKGSRRTVVETRFVEPLM